MHGLKMGSKYLWYFLNAKGRHSAHSPFLYQFIEEVLNNKTTQADYQKVESLRKQLLKSDQEISVIDLGAGSRLNSGSTRKVSDITRNVSKSPKFGQLLYRLASHFKPTTILEIGTALGISTAYLALGNPKAKMFSLEGNPESVKIAKQNLISLQIQNAEVLEGHFEHSLPLALDQLEQIDLLFIDGNHQKIPTLSYFEQCIKKLGPNSLMVVDDIHWSKGMEAAWAQIKKHPDCRLCLDLFFMGLVFFRPELSKEAHRIRF